MVSPPAITQPYCPSTGRQPLGESLDPGDLCLAGQRQRQEGSERLRSHGRDVAHVHGQRLPAQVLRARPGAAKVDLLHQRVHRGDQGAIRRHLQQRRVVADAKSYLTGAESQPRAAPASRLAMRSIRPNSPTSPNRIVPPVSYSPQRRRGRGGALIAGPTRNAKARKSENAKFKGDPDVRKRRWIDAPFSSVSGSSPFRAFAFSTAGLRVPPCLRVPWFSGTPRPLCGLCASAVRETRYPLLASQSR